MESVMSADEKEVLEFFKKDRFAVSNGIKLVSAKPGFAVTELEVGDRHMNAADTIQGGAVFTLADYAFAAASNAAGQLALAVNAQISFFRATKGGKLTAEARETSGSNRLGHYIVEVKNEKNEAVANFYGTVYKTEKVWKTEK
jgi:acyl-CoA thioesterase